MVWPITNRLSTYIKSCFPDNERVMTLRQILRNGTVIPYSNTSSNSIVIFINFNSESNKKATGE